MHLTLRAKALNCKHRYGMACAYLLRPTAGSSAGVLADSVVSATAGIVAPAGLRADVSEFAPMVEKDCGHTLLAAIRSSSVISMLVGA